MNEIAEKVSTAFIAITRSIFQYDFSNVQQVKVCWHNLHYILFSIINYSRIFVNQNKNFRNFGEMLFIMNKLGLLPQKTFEFFNVYRDLIEPILLDTIIKNFQTINSRDLSVIYEYLLSFELLISHYKIEVIIGKNRKDIAGAYYTSTDLAQAVVDEVFTKYEASYLKNIDIDGHSLYQGVCIADLSCGSGEFFRAAQRYLLEKHKISLTESCTYFWGIDVDPVALQITICDLLTVANQEDWKKIINHFFLGNPLIDTKTESTFSEKSDLFALNRIYANGMGLDFSTYFKDKRFDIVIGNPPWERIRFEERKFFANICPEITAIPKKDKRQEAINTLKVNWPDAYFWAMNVYNDYKVMNSVTFQHPKIKVTVVGELNTYALFTELAFEITKPSGVCSLIVKSTLVTSPINKDFWNTLISGGFVHSVYLFDNKRKMFNIDSREKFCIITLSHKGKSSFRFAAGLMTADEMSKSIPSNVSKNDLITVNPFTGMLPSITSTDDMQILVEIHKKLPLFDDVYPNCHFGRLIHLTAHAEYIDMEANENNIPIYEGKFIEQYDARFSTFETLDDKRKYVAKASSIKSSDNGNGKSLPLSRFFIQKSFWKKYSRRYPEQFSLCWRSLTSSTNSRTAIAMILPTCPTCQSIQMLQVCNKLQLLEMLGLFNSIPFDYLVRLKMPGIDLTQTVIKQIPVPSREVYKKKILYQGRKTTLEKHIFSHIYYLLQKEPLLKDLLFDINYPVYRIESEISDNLSVRRALDYLYAKAYDISDDIFDKILLTFPKYKKEHKIMSTVPFN